MIAIHYAIHFPFLVTMGTQIMLFLFLIQGDDALVLGEDSTMPPLVRMLHSIDRVPCPANTRSQDFRCCEAASIMCFEVASPVAIAVVPLVVVKVVPLSPWESSCCCQDRLSHRYYTTRSTRRSCYNRLFDR